MSYGKQLRILAGLLSSFYAAQAMFFARNTIKPYDRYLWQEPQEPGRFQFMGYFASTSHEKACRWDSEKVCDVLQVYECDQDALAMVRGFDPSSCVGQFAIQLNDVSDDGVRGHVVPYGKFHMSEAGFGVRYWFIHNLYAGVYIPFVRMSLNNISWCDLTKDINQEDYVTKELLTNNLATNVCQLGGLNICSNWKRGGIGDMSVLLGWERNFPQAKPILTNVRLALYAGASLPTGGRVNPTQLFSLPLGYDGAPGVLFGGHLGLTWKHHFIGGVEGYFTQLIGNTRLRRIKTDNNQTELLLLAQTQAHIDWGFIQRYRLYLGGYNLIRGLSFDINYQFQKQGNSTISFCGNDYIPAIAQTSRALCQWTLHTIGVNVLYDWDFDLSDKARFVPRLSFFYQHDFKGHRAILLNKWGFSFGFTF